MAVEYEISSDVAVIKETGSVSQCARVTQMYSGQITYDDEAGSKFATATINGKSQRVMLCIAVNGTVNYDDVPSLYSTVDGHRCLNIVTPTETGTPDDVPSLYETVVIDGQNVRAVRCIMINKTPVYDGVSSTCTFTGDDGKTHTAQLVNKITGGSVVVIIKGTSPLNLPDAIANSLSYVKAFGGTEQRNIPQPYTQVNYVTNTAQTAVNTGIMIDFAKNYEFEVECRAVSGSWYILQSRASASGNVTGIHGETSGSTIKLVVGNVTICTSAITRTVGNKLYVKATLNAGTATLYVKDETANTEDTQTGSYGTTQPNPTAAVYLLGNAGEQYVDVNSDIYMARIKENGVTVMDYVPARQVATAGFYDTVSGTFKTALTPANLSADGNTVPAPDAPMDIVSNNGVLKYGALGKNLFDGTVYNIAYLSNPSRVAYNASYRGIIVPVTAGNKYTISRQIVAGNRFNWYFTPTYPQDGDTVYNVGSTTATNLSATVTVPDGMSFLVVYFATNASDISPSKIQVELGDTATPYEPYRAGIYADGTVETINVHGKNLFDDNSPVYKCSAIGNNTVVSSFTSVSSTSNAQTYGMAVKPNTTYTISKVDGNRLAIGGFKSVTIPGDSQITAEYSYNGIRNTFTGSKTFTTDSDCVWILVCVRNNTTIYDEATNIQLELGSTATTYEPYYDGGTATAEMLLKVGDYQDVQSIIDGVVTRNTAALVLTGTEAWTAGSSGTGYRKMSLQLTNVGATGTDSAGLCTHYKCEYANTVGNFYFSSGGTLQMVVASTETSSGFKQGLADQYAAGTPVIVVYTLETPTTESVTGQTLQVTGGDNVLEITQASLNGLELEAKYKAAVSLTIQEVQDANLDPNVEVTIS